MNAAQFEHHLRCAAASASLRSEEADAVRALKPGTHLFRDRRPAPARRLDLRDFKHLLAINAAEGWVEVEGGMDYEALVDALLAHGLRPAVVPQLKGITVGGAAAGLGIEASSFRHGLVHQTLLSMDLLLASGDRVHCTPDNEHAALFRGFPNSYGTLGYALALRLRVLPARRFVSIEHRRFGSANELLAALPAACDDTTLDFVDAVVFGPGCAVLNTARLVDQVPWQSDYGGEHIYYRSLLERGQDYLSLRDWLWRWDTDWFWCSRQFGAEHPLVRKLLGRRRLGSRSYQRLMRWATALGVNHAWSRLRGRHAESVIQDIDIPAERSGEFLAFLLREVGLLPIWVCPLVEHGGPFPLYPLTQGRLYLNFGFWGVVESQKAHEPGHLNRRIERQTQALGGIKSLYSDSFFDRDRFEQCYGGASYRALKQRYDPQGRLHELYEKCVLRV